jgi:biotin synthase
MSMSEIMTSVDLAAQNNCDTIVLQGGEDRGANPVWIAELIAEIKARTGLPVTLSLGERDPRVYDLWRRAGADRYLLRFETSEPRLYGRYHPPHRRGEPGRVELLRALAALGYEVGSGFIVGLPGQDVDSLTDDLDLVRSLALSMVAVGPFIPHPDTPLGRRALRSGDGRRRARSAATRTLTVVALARLLCPEAHIPVTSATLVAGGNAARSAFEGGADVTMKNLTPPRFRRSFRIYPGKESV